MTPIELLRRLRRPGGRAILVLTRYPTGEDLKDGYYQRVASIDALLAASPRVYASPVRKRTFLPRVSQVGEDVFDVTYHPRRLLHFLFLAFVALKSRAVYVHSIYSLKSRTAWWLFRLARRAILDFHGVVPEELALLGDGRAAELAAVEARAIARADVIVSITTAMTEHVRRKHAIRDGAKSFVMVPHLPARTVSEPRTRYSKNVVYCGGLQKWQQIEKMFSYVRAHAGECHFTFLVPRPEALREAYRKLHGEEFPGEVATASPGELGEWYARNAFGLVLREDNVVNRVACPSKYVEYLLHGLVPIVDSDEVGDFKALGVRTVGLAEPLPGADAWREMVARNLQALRALDDALQAGAAELRGVVEGRLDPSSRTAR